MTKRDYNSNVSTRLGNGEVDFDMLIQGYALLDKDVSKYAYLKKKWANGGISNKCYQVEFDTAIKKRNEIQKILRKHYVLTDSDIKENSKGVEVLITRKNCDELVEMLKNRRFTVLD